LYTWTPSITTFPTGVTQTVSPTDTFSGLQSSTNTPSVTTVNSVSYSDTSSSSH
jgi:hypothetical protein